MAKQILPKPNVTYAPTDSHLLDESNIKGMICNPVYAGLPPFQQLVNDEAWISAATQLIKEEGPEQFLVNMLYMLRQSLESTTANRQPVSPPPPQPDSPSLYCYHDDFPMLEMHGNYVCVAEYLFEHLDDTPVTDLVLKPDLALVFQNGHTLPLLWGAQEDAWNAEDSDALLEMLQGLSIIDVEWDEDDQFLILYFGSPVDLDEALELDPLDMLTSIAVKVESVQRMTCPYLTGSALKPQNL